SRRHVHYRPSSPEPLPDALDFWTIVNAPAELLLPAQPVDTSLEAAARVQGHTARLREEVYQFIRVTRGATDGEIAQGLGMNPSTVRPRRRELEGTAPWAKGKLPARIERTSARRLGMRIYQVADTGGQG